MCEHTDPEQEQRVSSGKRNRSENRMANKLAQTMTGRKRAPLSHSPSRRNLIETLFAMFRGWASLVIAAPQHDRVFNRQIFQTTRKSSDINSIIRKRLCDFGARRSAQQNPLLRRYDGAFVGLLVCLHVGSGFHLSAA